ncbi:MAG: carboxypeptidase regulatory-like domain-containing protein [Gemmatimonadetes bacterium]|nr:carboxypeptidase regulatory-like domain-containing protein [Gemmatimonadota bacterium]
MNPLRTAVFAALALALAHVSAQAQVIRGQVLEGGSNAPVEGAMVVLLEPGGHVVRRVLTDRSGGFIVRADRPGSYLVRVDRIGYESLTTDPFDLTPEGTFQRVMMPIQPVELEGLEVGGSRRCELRNEQGETTARVWEEARKALEAAAWTLSSGTYRYTLLGYERELDRDMRIVKEQRQFQRGTGQAPYVSFPASELVEEGFVIANRDRSFTYRAPDAAAFLSDEFLDTHCMSLEAIEDGLIGLEFQPIRGRRTTDIRGTLWIEAGTASLRRLEFRYVNLPVGPDQGNAGGEVIFGRLPNGTWIVREWNIRMPMATVNPDRTRVSITGYIVQGGVVWRVVDRDGTAVVESETATVSGTVVDSLEAAPVEGARVRSADGGGEGVTAGAGSFFLPGLPPGLVTLEVFHPYLDSLQLGPVVARVEATAGEVASVRVKLPGVEELLAGVCADTAATERAAAVLGRVRRGTQPAAGTRVRVRWQGPDMQDFRLTSQAAPPLPDESGPEWREDPQGANWIETNLDHRGIFLVCGVPARTQLRVEVGEGLEADALTVTVPLGTRVVVVPIALGLTGTR